MSTTLLGVLLPPNGRFMPVPRGLTPEVLAIEKSGNQTIRLGFFETE